MTGTCSLVTLVWYMVTCKKVTKWKLDQLHTSSNLRAALARICLWTEARLLWDTLSFLSRTFSQLPIASNNATACWSVRPTWILTKLLSKWCQRLKPAQRRPPQHVSQPAPREMDSLTRSAYLWGGGEQVYLWGGQVWIRMWSNISLEQRIDREMCIPLRSSLLSCVFSTNALKRDSLSLLLMAAVLLIQASSSLTWKSRSLPLDVENFLGCVRLIIFIL